MSIIRACSYADIWFALAASVVVSGLMFANGAPAWAATGTGSIVQVSLIVGGAIVGAINERGER